MSLQEYREFIASRAPIIAQRGFQPAPINKAAKQHQINVLEFALNIGQSAAFLDTGLGKSFIELEFARQCAEETGKPSLILTPLAVAGQMIRNQLGAGVMVANSGDVGYCLTASAQGSLDAETETMVAQPISFGAQNAAAQGDGVAVGFVGALDKSKTPGVAFGMDGAAHCLRSGASKADKPDSTTYVAAPWAVRRLTPIECERLQGFPDYFTSIPYRGKPADKCPDGPRYKAIGNSWAVNCADWLAERIEQVDAW